MATKKVILFSGGLDSFIGYNLLREHGSWKPIYFNLGSRYSRKEMDNPILADIRVHNNLELGTIERPDAFIPQRNVMLCTLAQAKYDATDIALCAVRGEFSRDKHRRFYADISRLLSYTAEHRVRVFSPVAHLTKTQAVRWYLQQGYHPMQLLMTTSCYDEKEEACGKCMSCFRRWVALENNGLVDERFASPPHEWVRTHHQPLRTLARLPIREWRAFAAAQVDVATAMMRVRRRLS